jgi:hypothetical protein
MMEEKQKQAAKKAKAAKEKREKNYMPAD